MSWIASTPYGTLAASTTVAVLTGIAIIGFGAPPWILVIAAYGGGAAYAAFADRYRQPRRR